MEFKKQKAAVIGNRRRNRFIGLELFLGIVFVLGYSVIDELFLQDYVGAAYNMGVLEYILYIIGMIGLMFIFVCIWILVGMYFQRWLTEKAAATLMQQVKDHPETLMGLINGGLLDD